MEIIELMFILIVALIMFIGIIANRRIDKASDVSIHIIKMQPYLYRHLPSLERMVFSFKPLTIDYWLEYCKNKSDEA